MARKDKNATATERSSNIAETSIVPSDVTPVTPVAPENESVVDVDVDVDETIAYPPPPPTDSEEWQNRVLDMSLDEFQHHVNQKVELPVNVTQEQFDWLDSIGFFNESVDDVPPNESVDDVPPNESVDDVPPLLSSPPYRFPEREHPSKNFVNRLQVERAPNDLGLSVTKGDTCFHLNASWRGGVCIIQGNNACPFLGGHQEQCKLYEDFESGKARERARRPF